MDEIDFSKYLTSTGKIISKAPLHIRRAWFVKQGKEKFGDAFDWESLEYTANNATMTITCRKHGTVICIPKNFLKSKTGCCTACAKENKQ